MKQVRSIFLTALAALAFAGCNKDEVVDAGGSSPGEVLTGEETYVSFNFRVEGNKTHTRGAMIPGEAAASENEVTDGRILIFDDASGTLLNNETFTASGTTANITIKTTSGRRRIYIITGAGKAQMGERLNTLQTTAPISTLANFYALMTDGKYASGPDDDMGNGFKELPTTNSFVMSNVADINAVKTLLPNISQSESATGGAGGGGADETVNRFDFNVLRAVAKGDLKVELKQNTLTTADNVFTLKKEVTYGVRNVNRSTLYVQQFINDKQTADMNDHTKEAGLRPFAAFYHVFDGKGSDDLKQLSTYRPYYFGGYDIKGNAAVQTEMKASGGGAATAGKSVYFSENSNNMQLRGNTTYYGITTQVASIAAKNIAASITFDEVGGIKSEAETTPYTTGDFWYIREIPADIEHKLVPPVRRVFTDELTAFQAVAIIAANSSSLKLTTEGFKPDQTYTPGELKDAYHGIGGKGALGDTDKALIDLYLGRYVNGLSYYRLNLYETTTDGTRRHLVRRNHNYQATVTSFATIGDPTEGDLDKDPEKPVDADVTNVTAIIKVVGWENVAMEDDL